MKETIKETGYLFIVFIGVVMAGVMFQAVVDTMYYFYKLL